MTEIPLFPLPLVLFPGGRLPLQIFEVRYLDMIKSCMRENSGFGVVMLETGNELFDGHNALANISTEGTYTIIVDFDQFPNGMLGIMTEGRTKFVIREKYEQKDHLLVAHFQCVYDKLPNDVFCQLNQLFVDHILDTVSYTHLTLPTKRIV